MRLRLSACLAALALVAATACGSPPDTRELDGTTVHRLDDAIADVMAKAGIPGAIVGVWTPRGEYVRATGVANKTDGSAMQVDFFSRIGSVTKTFTVTAILQLVDDGKIGLDDPVSKFVDGVPDGEHITLRELAGMRSGLFNYSMSEAFERDLQANPRKQFTPRELLAYAFAKPPAFPPGKGFQYSNTNAILLGLVVQKVTGQRLADFVAEHISKPLGLSHTSIPASPAIPDPHAHGYTRATPDAPVVDSTDWDPSWAGAAGDMISTLDDLKIWAPALANGTLLKPETQAQRLKMVPMPPVPDDIGYGLGFFNARGWIGHNGSIPGYQTLMVYSPAEQITVVAMVNTDIARQPAQPSTLLGTAITKVITPQHVFMLENAITQPR